MAPRNRLIQAGTEEVRVLQDRDGGSSAISGLVGGMPATRQRLRRREFCCPRLTRRDLSGFTLISYFIQTSKLQMWSNAAPGSRELRELGSPA